MQRLNIPQIAEFTLLQLLKAVVDSPGSRLYISPATVSSLFAC